MAVSRWYRPAPTTTPAPKPPAPVGGVATGVDPAQAANVARLQNMTPEQLARFKQFVAGAQAPPPAAPGAAAPGGPAFVLPGSAEALYQGQRQDVNEQYGEAVAQNAFERNATALDYAQTVGENQTAYDKQRALEPQQFVNRGILGSGIQRQDLLQNAIDYRHQIGRTQLAQDTALGRFDLAKQQLDRKRTLGLANLAMKHAADLSDAAGRSIK